MALAFLVRQGYAPGVEPYHGTAVKLCLVVSLLYSRVPILPVPQKNCQTLGQQVARLLAGESTLLAEEVRRIQGPLCMNVQANDAPLHTQS
jgi:hypothetical protein